MPLEQQRDAFDLPASLVYLNCAEQSPSLKTSHEAGRTALLRKHHPWIPERQHIRAEMDTSRELFARLIGAHADNIALVGSTSYGVALAAKSIALGPGQNVVLIEDQFPSNYYAWQTLARENNATFNIVARPADANWTDAILNAIDDNTALVALPNCHWSDGSLIDLEKIAPRVHEVGAAFVIDATQSIGVKRLDVNKLNPDFVMCSAYKWLLSPNSSGFLYVAERRLASQPLEQNHSARNPATPMELALEYTSKFKAGARRFDYGAANNVILQPMTIKALEQINIWGQENIHEYLTRLIDKTAAMAEVRGFEFPGRHYRIGHFIGLTTQKKLDVELAKKMAEMNVHISLRVGKIRISPYVFNSESDIETLFEALDRL